MQIYPNDDDYEELYFRLIKQSEQMIFEISELLELYKNNCNDKKYKEMYIELLIKLDEKIKKIDGIKEIHKGDLILY